MGPVAKTFAEQLKFHKLIEVDREDADGLRSAVDVSRTELRNNGWVNVLYGH